MKIITHYIPGRTSYLSTLLTIALICPLLGPLTDTSSAGELKGGPEWEVSNRNVYRGDKSVPLLAALKHVANPFNVKAQQRMAKSIRIRCPDCNFEDVVNKFGMPAIKVTFPHLENYWVILDIDPATVEIQGKPLTIAGYKKFKDDIQYLVFDSARAAKLTPRWDLSGAGHIHLDMKSTFQGDRMLFRNFVVDYMNNPQLASGILDFDHVNAPPLRAMTGKQIEAMNKILADFDNSSMSIEVFAQRIVNEVQNFHPSDWMPSAKYQALNFLRIINPDTPEHERTLEIRALRAQRNMDEFILVLELFQSRIDFLAKSKKPIALNMPVMERLTPAQSEIRFKAYVTSSGQDWDKFKVLMPKYAEDSALAETAVYDFSSTEKLSERMKELTEVYQSRRDQVISYHRMLKGVQTAGIKNSADFYQYVSAHHPTVLPMVQHPSVISILRRHPQLGWTTVFSRLEIINNLMNNGPATYWKSLNATPVEIAEVMLSYPIKNLTTEELEREYLEFRRVFSNITAAASYSERKEISKIQLSRDIEFQAAQENLASATATVQSCQQFYKVKAGLSSFK